MLITPINDVFSIGTEGYIELTSLINDIPLLNSMVSSNRRTVSSMPKDKQGKVIVDFSNPHILENMSYFIKARESFITTGKYCEYYPSKNVSSPYRKFWDEEIRRCLEGLVREDGEWIPGYYYYYLNYSPIIVTVKSEEEESNKAQRVVGFPDVWDGDYLFFHYVDRAEKSGMHGAVLKARGKGYSYKLASMLQRNYFLIAKSKSFAIAAESEYLDTDGILNKADDNFSFVNTHCGFSKKLALSDKLMHRISGYTKPGDATKYGFKSERIGVTLKNNPNKAHPYSTTVYTPEGQKLWGDIKVGSTLFNSDSTLTRVTEVHELGDQDIYKVTFNDNRETYCTLGHRWEIQRFGYKGLKTYIYTTEELIALIKQPSTQTFNRLKISISSSVNFDYKEVPIDSYTLGLMLGDGCIVKSTNNQSPITMLEEDFLEISKYIPYKTKHYYASSRNTDNVIFIPNGRNLYKNLNLFDKRSGDKFIPDIYKYNTKEIRLAVINGLLDTDGSVTKDYGVIEYSTKSLQMANDFIWIIRSLGIGAKKSNKIINGITYYRCYVYATSTELSLFRLKRKKDRIQLKKENSYANNKRKYIQIKSIEYSHKEKAKCVTVDNDKEMYLIGEFIPTLNSRGKRGKLLAFEESGSNPNLLKAWNIARKSVEDGNRVFGFMVAFGTGGDEESNFQGLEQLFYSCKAYKVFGIKNVFDKNSETGTCGFFVPDYLNRADCYDENGNSDVTKALGEVINNRLTVKYSSNDSSNLTRVKAEEPITPQEAVMRTQGSEFPINELKDHLIEISPLKEQFLSHHYVVELVWKGPDTVEYKPIFDRYPIREFPYKGTDLKGCVELYELPQMGKNKEIPRGRYLVGVDPVDDDTMKTYGVSLFCAYVFDLWNDVFVAEWIGRYPNADDNFDMALKLATLYNAEINYENKLKGLYEYINRKNKLKYLMETPGILKDMDYIKDTRLIGNRAYGTPTNPSINAFARKQLADWMRSININRGAVVLDEFGNDKKEGILGVKTLRSFGLIKEAISWNLDGNFDRISAAGMVFIARADKFKLIEASKRIDTSNVDSYANDEFLRNNYRSPYSNSFGNDLFSTFVSNS